MMRRRHRAPRRHRRPPSTPKEIERQNKKRRQQAHEQWDQTAEEILNPVISIADANELAQIAGVGDEQGGAPLQTWFIEQHKILRHIPAIRQVPRLSPEPPHRKLPAQRGRPVTIGHMKTAGILLAEKYNELSNKPIRYAGALKSWEGRRADPCTKFIALGLKVFFPGIEDREIWTVFQDLRINKDIL